MLLEHAAQSGSVCDLPRVHPDFRGVGLVTTKLDAYMMAPAISAVAGYPRSIDIKRALLPDKPTALSAPFDAMLHVACNHGHNLPATRLGVSDGRCQVRIAEVTFSSTKVAAPDGIAALA